MAGLLTIFLACVVFVHRLYSAKLATIVEARDSAWSDALPGCSAQPGAEYGDAASLLGEVDRESEEPDESEVEAWVSEPGRGAGNSDTLTVGMGRLLGGRRFHMHTSVSLACNEQGGQQLYDGRIMSVFDYFRQSYGRWWN